MNGIEVRVLGCSGSYPSVEEPCTGFLVSTSTTRVWLDCGSGTLAELQRHLDLVDLDAIIVSHVHPDHMSDLPIAANALHWYLGGASVPVLTTAQVRDRCRQDAATAADGAFRWIIAAPDESVELGAFTVRVSLTDHPVDTLAVRLEADGVALGFTSDTGPGWHCEGLGSGLDVLIGEATLLEADDDGQAPHISAAHLGRMAAEAGVGELWVSHVPPFEDREARRAEAADTFGGPTRLLGRGQRLEVGARGESSSTT